MPDKKISDLNCARRITGKNLKPVPVPETAVIITPDAQGRLTLDADDATLHGDQLKLDEQGGKPDIGFWDKAEEWVSWNAKISRPGKYQVTATIAAASGEANFVVAIGAENLAAKIPATDGWEHFVTADLGTVELKQTGDLVVKVRAKDAASWRAINLNAIQLTPAE